MKQEESQEEKILKTVKYLYESGLSEDPFIGQLLQDAHLTGDFSELLHHLEKNPEQIASVNRGNVVKEYLAKQFPFYPLPNGEELAKLTGPIKLGIINSFRGVKAFLGLFPDILTMHVLIAGRTGTGKSWLNLFAIFQLLPLTKNLGFNILIPDLKLFYRRLLGKVEGFKIITFDKFMINVLEVPKWMNPRDFIYLFARVFASENLLWVPSINLYTEAIHELFRRRGIFDGSKNYPNLLDLLNIISAFQNDKIRGPRYRDIYESTTNRLKPYLFLGKNILVPRGINLDVFTKENVVLEFPLHMMSENMHNFFISFIANLMYVRNITLGLRGDHLRHLLMIDEARTLLGAHREHSGLENIEPGMNEIIAKGREFGFALWFCSQEMGSFSQIFRSNCLLKIVFPLTDGRDVTEVENSLGLTKEQSQFTYTLPRQRAAVCRFGEFERPFLMEVPQLQGLNTIPSDEEVHNQMDDFYQDILPKQEANPYEIKEEITPRFKYSSAEFGAFAMLNLLVSNPFMNYGDLIKELKLTPARGDAARVCLVNTGLVNTRSITLRRGKPGEYFELTAEAYRELGGRPPRGKGSFEHKCLCHAIKDSMEEEGFEAEVEGTLKGNPKLFDVLAWKKGEGMIGYEVTLTFHNLIKNLRDDLGTTVKKVIVVCRNKEELKEAKLMVRRELGDVSRVEFKTIFEFTQKNKD